MEARGHGLYFVQYGALVFNFSSFKVAKICESMCCDQSILESSSRLAFPKESNPRLHTINLYVGKHFYDQVL